MIDLAAIEILMAPKILASGPVYVHLMRGQDSIDCAADFAAGKSPEISPYGFHRAAFYGFEVSFSRDRKHKALDLLGRLSSRMLGFDLFHALANLRSIRRATLVWTMTEGEAFAVALIFALRLARKSPIVANSVWVINEWDSLPSWRRAIFRYLARYLSVLTVHSGACLEPAQRAFPNTDVRLVYFGINKDMFPLQPRDERGDLPIRIFAAGNDRTRDWDTLLQALGTDPRFTVKLACRWVTAEQIAPYPTVKLVRDPSMAMFRSLYNWADLIAIPMRENLFSGTTVALEAAALGIPILSARTGAIPTYFEDDALFYYPVGDADGLRQVAANASAVEREARAAKAHAVFQQRDYSTQALVRQYIAISQDVMPMGMPVEPGQKLPHEDSLDASGAGATA